MNYEVAIIGGGASGIFAALRLLKSSISVIMIRQSELNSAHLGSSLMFISRYDGRGKPLSICDEAGEETGFISTFRDVFKEYEFGSSTYLDLNGNLIEASFAPSWCVSIEKISTSKPIIISFKGIYDCRAEKLLAQSIAKDCGSKPEIFQIRLQSNIEEFLLSPMQWARKFDTPTTRKQLINQIVFQLKPIKASAIIFPPILGITNLRQNINELQSKLNASIYETAGTPYWPPGFRTGFLLNRAIENSGVELISDTVEKFYGNEGGGLRALLTAGGKEIEADHFLLATGGLLGRGIEFNQTLREKILDLPVLFRGKKLNRPTGQYGSPPEKFWAEKISENEVVINAGLNIDKDATVINEYGRVVAHNLSACGSILEGKGKFKRVYPVDPGLSAISGWIIAGKLLKKIKRERENGF